MSNATKQALEASLKNMMLKKPLDKITSGVGMRGRCKAGDPGKKNV